MPRSNKSGVSDASVSAPVITPIAQSAPEAIRVIRDSEWVGEFGPEVTDVPAETEVTPSPGNSSSTSPAKHASTPKRNEKRSQPPAPTTGSH